METHPVVRIFREWRDSVAQAMIANIPEDSLAALVMLWYTEHVPWHRGKERLTLFLKLILGLGGLAVRGANKSIQNRDQSVGAKPGMMDRRFLVA
jgi:hypothetical protein